MAWLVLPPLRTSNAWVLRTAPQWGPYAVVIASIALHGLLLACLTVVAAAMPDGDGFAWRSMWRQVLFTWVVYAMHAAAIRVVFWAHARVLRGPRVHVDVEGGGDLKDIHAYAADGMGEERPRHDDLAEHVVLEGAVPPIDAGNDVWALDAEPAGKL